MFGTARLAQCQRRLMGADNTFSSRNGGNRQPSYYLQPKIFWLACGWRAMATARSSVLGGCAQADEHMCVPHENSNNGNRNRAVLDAAAEDGESGIERLIRQLAVPVYPFLPFSFPRALLLASPPDRCGAEARPAPFATFRWWPRRAGSGGGGGAGAGMSAVIHPSDGGRGAECRIRPDVSQPLPLAAFTSLHFPSRPVSHRYPVLPGLRCALAVCPAIPAGRF